jgi:AraC-like DNA-binding protein
MLVMQRIKAVGEKYMDYLLRRRLDEAKRLLLGTGLKIDDIALRVG